MPPGYTPTRVPPGTTHARVQTPRSQVPETVRPTKTPLNPRLRLPIFPRSPGTALPNPAVYFGRAQPGAPMYRTPISFPSPTLTNREELYRIYGPPSASCIQQAGELAKKVAQTQNGKRVRSLSGKRKTFYKLKNVLLFCKAFSQQKLMFTNFLIIITVFQHD